MKKLKKLLSLVVSAALLVTTLPINSFSANYPVLPQYEFSNFAKITSANFYDSDTTVINIQDLHNNKEVQDNIYKLLSSLNKQYENLDVYIEGATDSVDYKKMSESMSEKEMSALMNGLYENDKISGAEMFGYKNNKALKPTEQKDIYEQNIQNYSFLIKNKQQINDLLFAKYENIKSLDDNLTAEQRKLLKFYNAYLNKKISSEKFYNKIFSELSNRKISDLKYINTKLYIDVMKTSKNINQKAAERQLQTVLAKLKSTITYQDYVNLLKDSNNLTDINVIFAYLSAHINKNDKITKYPDLFNLISLRELSSLINPLDLIEEERQMLEDILLSYSKYAKNKDIVFINLFFQIYKKLLFAGISSSEYEYYKNNYRRFSNLYSKYLSDDLFDLFDYARVAERFNELNVKRNLSFINSISSDITADKNYADHFRGKIYNINKILSSLNKTKSLKVIISGGFHTEGINALLDKNKISYITLTPNVKENDSLYEQKYLDSIVEQAEVEKNAIAKRPFLEQNSQIIISNIVSSIDSISKNLESGKSLKEIEDIINGVIKANSLEDIVAFNIDSNSVATIRIDDKVYTLSYNKGKVTVKDNFSTTMAKNIKVLIKAALEVPDFRALLGLAEEFDETKIYGDNQEAEFFFRKHNILFSDFAYECLKVIVKSVEVDVTDKSGDKVYQTLLKVKDNFAGQLFSGEITIGKSPLLIGARPDGYGNTEEYGSLFYVTWGKNENNVNVAKEILVSKYLLDNLQGRSEQQLKEFFVTLFVHERLEMLALTGASKQFNSYVLRNKLSRTSEVFHQYIRSSDFNSFLAEQGKSSDGVKEQRDLLDEMDKIISDVNKENSHYSNIISVSSLKEDTTDYEKEDLDAFLSIRAGEKDAIAEYNSKLLKKVVSQIEKEFILEQKTNNPNFDIEKDFNAKKFKEFINSFVVVYRKNNNYISSDKFADLIKEKLVEKYGDKLKENRDSISIRSYELEEDSNGKYVLNDSIELNKNRIFFVEDIISRQSETFNDVYNFLMKKQAKQVQGLSFFDLSKEPDGKNLITDSVYKQILSGQEDSIFFNVLTNVNGNIQKYFAYWLVRLSKDAKGHKIIEKISSMDKKIVDNLMTSLMNMVKENNFARGIKCYEIINLILFIGFGEQKDVNSITKAEMDEFNKKYNFKVEKKKDGLALEASYEDWKESIASLVLYAYMSGYDYIEASKINDFSKVYGNEEKPNDEIIAEFCEEFNISFMDEKTKLKHAYKTVDTDELSKQIEIEKQKLEQAKNTFNNKVEKIKIEYEEVNDVEKYLARIEEAEDEYRTAVKNAMISAKEIVIENLNSKKMKIDDSLFAIIIGGSLAKGNMMKESDIYYDIIVPNNTISKSIDKHFAPLYSSVLQEIGLKNYYLLKYSSTNLNKKNINTFVDEKEIAPFLNYAPLSERESKKQLFLKYRNETIKNLRKNVKKQKTLKENLNIITDKYYSISHDGKNWLGNSFYIAYKDNESFSTRWTLMTLESRLNEIIYSYIVKHKDEDIDIPVSVKEQIDFIRQKNINVNTDKLDFYWEYLSACRYIKKNNTWTELSPMEHEAIEEINKFVDLTKEYLFREGHSDNQKLLKIESLPIPKNTIFIRKILPIKKEKLQYDGLLEKVETLFYENSTDLEEFRKGYVKYAHLREWEKHTDSKNKDVFVKAKIIALLSGMDIKEVEEKLKQMLGEGRYAKDINSIIDSIKIINFIDEKFPSYSSLEGERSLQNYWDAVAMTTKNPETLFALIAHKLTKAQSSDNVEDQLLLYSVYLPLSKRFGNPDIYEYVRNNSFECSHPVQYLNLLNIISSLYGTSYSQIQKKKITKLKEKMQNYLTEQGIDAGDVEIKMRVKSLYSIYEKLNSSRKKDDTEIKELNDIEKNAMKFILNSEELFTRIEENVKDNSENGNDVFDSDESLTPEVKRSNLQGLLDKNFGDLEQKEKESLIKYFGKIRESLFTDYYFMDYVNDKLSGILEKCKDNNGFVDKDKLDTALKNGGEKMYFPMWVINLFGAELKDLIGFHVVVKDETFSKVVDAINASKDGEPYAEIKKYFAESEEDKKSEKEEDDDEDYESEKENDDDDIDESVFFQTFYKDTKNKQAREKINATIKMNKGVPAPMELCIYEKTDYENETYGLYNQKKMSAPHYIYKMGKDYDTSLFEHIFAKETEYDFITKDSDSSSRTKSEEIKKKQMVYESDGFVPTEDLSENFKKVMEKISGNITCFAEYEDGIYVQKLPKGSTVFDLATDKYFSDDVNVAVYLESGDQITSDFELDDVTTYKVIKRKGCFVSVPKEGDVHTTRAKLIYKRKTSQQRKAFSEFINSVDSVSDINEFINLFNNKEFREILDAGNLDYSGIADKLFDEKSQNTILKDKELIIKALSLLFNTMSNKKCKKILPSQFIKRSTQIANHYNLANFFELFEAISYEIINFEDIRPFYDMCLVIETKSDNISVDEISSFFNAKKITGNEDEYNLVINGNKFFVENLPLVEKNSMQQIVDSLNSTDIGLTVENIVYQDKERIKAEKNKIFVYAGFVQPKQEFPLMSLGNNVEMLVKHAMMHHSRLVTNILKMTGEIAQQYEIMPKTEENISDLINEEPGLMAQVLMGLFSQDTYGEQELLAQETPFLTQKEINFVKDIKNMDFSQYSDLLEKYKIDSDKIKQDFSNITLKVSRSFDLHVDKEDVFSFATIDADSEGVTLYVSEALLRELSKLSEDERQLLLEQLVLHEVMEKEILSLNQNMNYEDIHKEFEQYKGQKKLMDFVIKTAASNVSETREALLEEIDALLEQSDVTETDSKTTIALMFGNLNIDSFINTYKAYRDKKVGQIFISGNTRGSLPIMKILRNTKRYPEYKSLSEGIKQNADISSVKTVKDLLSLSDEAFQKLTHKDLENIPRSTQVRYLNEGVSTPVSRDEIFDLVSEDGLTEAAIIKWVMLESAREDGLTRKEINSLIKAMSLETNAANTLQNIENIFAQQEFIDFISGKDNIDIIVVQNPFSQSRAKATLNKYLHSNRDNPALQDKKFGIHSMKFGYDAMDYYTTTEKLTKSLGEWTRLIAYTLKGDIIPSMNSEEGLNSIPLEILIKVLSLMPLLTAKEKDAVKAVFTNISGSREDIKTMLKDYSDKNQVDQNKYDLIDQFIDYLFSDTTEQRQLEKTWEQIQTEDILPDLVVQEKIDVEERVSNTHKILSAA